MINIFTANLSYKKVLQAIELYFNSEATLSEYKPLDPFYTFGLGKNPVDGYYYFAAMSIAGPPLNRSSYVFKYDIATNTIIDQVHIPRTASITSSYDAHAIPTIQFDANGHIYMCNEKGDNGDGTTPEQHNSDFLIYKTGTAGVLSTITLWKTITGFYAYPKLWVNGATIYAGARGTKASLSFTKWAINKSIDSGATWTEYIVCELTGTPTRRAYFNTVHNFDNNDLTLVLNIRNEESASFESLSFMRSSDGITWSNAQGSFSKNVSTVAALTFAEIQNNMLVWGVNSAVRQVAFEGGCVKNGLVKLLISNSEIQPGPNNGNVKVKYLELRIYTFKNGEWTYKDMSSILPTDYIHLWAEERTIQYIPSLNEDTIAVLDRTDLNKVKLRRYISSDNFNSYQSKLDFEGAGNYYYGSNAFNSETLDEQLIILNDVQGPYDDFNSFSNLRVINPK